MNEKNNDVWQARYQFLTDDDPWLAKPYRDTGWRVIRQSYLWRPPTDVIETEEAYIVLVEVAGMRGAEFIVTYNKKLLTIRGSRADTSTRKAYHLQSTPPILMQLTTMVSSSLFFRSLDLSKSQYLNNMKPFRNRGKSVRTYVF